jgi:hypothetical protein
MHIKKKFNFCDECFKFGLWSLEKKTFKLLNILIIKKIKNLAYLLHSNNYGNIEIIIKYTTLGFKSHSTKIGFLSEISLTFYVHF